MRIMRMRIMLIAKKWRMAIPIVNWLRLLAFFLLLLDFHWLSCFLLTSTAFKWISSVFLRISTYFYCLSTDFIQTFYWLLLTLYWLINNFCWVLLSQQNKANWISIDDSTIFLNKQTKKTIFALVLLPQKPRQDFLNSAQRIMSKLNDVLSYHKHRQRRNVTRYHFFDY